VCKLGNCLWFVSISFAFEKIGNNVDAKATKIGPLLIEAIPRLNAMSNLKRFELGMSYHREDLVIEPNLVD
jgi:hypothetical protein